MIIIVHCLTIGSLCLGRCRRLTWFARTSLVDGIYPELVAGSLDQFLDTESQLSDGFLGDLHPSCLVSFLPLDDVASDLAASVEVGWCPGQGHLCLDDI